MSLDKDDIRAAVAANVISEPQAASLMALADRRRGTRENMDGLDEPFELFRGFNEIFIVIGLSILYGGWLGLTGLNAFGAGNMHIGFALYGAVTMVVVIALARYFTLKRRMVAPSIMLVAIFALSGVQVGASLSEGLGLSDATRTAFTAGVSTAALAGFYALFRIPITVAFIAVGVFVGVGAVFVLGGAEAPGFEDVFRLSGEGPFAIITVVLGLIGLAVAMRFDMSDPHRVTRRASAGFWLHVIAAPAIVNTVALTLFEMGGVIPQLALLAFLTGMALFAIVIDRRSFLVAGVGYVVGLAVVVLQGGAALAILALGLGLVLLGAKWEALRGSLMRALPDFKGKDKLPPWGLTEMDQ